MSAIGLASPFQFFLGILRTVKHSQHHDGLASNEIEHAVGKLAAVRPSDISKAHSVKERFVTHTSEPFLRFGFQTYSNTRLMLFIPGGRFGEVRPDERVKGELEPHGGCPRKSGPIPF